MRVGRGSGCFYTRSRRSLPFLEPPESPGLERFKETSPTEAVRCGTDHGQEVKTEILRYSSTTLVLTSKDCVRKPWAYGAADMLHSVAKEFFFENQRKGE
jgi:hypothetical protein